MGKGKKILLPLLALNAILPSYSTGNSVNNNTKDDRMFNRIIQNATESKSNKRNYQIIERILKLKNKELNDLYLQNDYIIKPEYLEWQVFVSNSYSERKNKDNTSENARYKSGIDGYYDEDGNFISSTQGVKVYKKEQEPKIIDLGMNIPLWKIEKSGYNIKMNLTAEKPEATYTSCEIILEALNIPILDLIKFTPKNPVINPTSQPTVQITITNLQSYDSYGGDTLLGTFKNVVSGQHYLSDVRGLPSVTGYTPTRDNAIIDYGYHTPGSAQNLYYSDVNSEMYVDVKRRRAVGLDASIPLTFESNGKIYLVSEETAGLEIQTGFAGFMEVKNTITGEITGTNLNQAAMMYTVEDGGTISGNHISSFINDGKIDLSGNNSTGINLNGGKLVIAGGTQTLKAKNNGIMTLSGEKSYGIVLTKNSIVESDSYILNDTNGILTMLGDKSGGIAVLSNLSSQTLNKGKISLLSNESFGLYSGVSNELKNEGTIEMTGTEESTGLISIGGYLTNDTNGSININGGTSNIGMFTSIGRINNNGTISINSGIGNTGVRLDGVSAFSDNNGRIEVEGLESKGVIVTNGAMFENFNMVEVKGTNAYGLVAQGGTIKGGTVEIDIAGFNSMGVYSGDSSTVSNIIITGGNIKLHDGGVNFGAGQNGTLILNGANFTVGEQSLGFFTQGNGQINIQNAVGTIKGGSTSSDRGTVFSIKGSGIGITEVNSISDLSGLLTLSGINSTNLTLNMETGSRLFSLGDASLKLSVVNSLNSSAISLPGVTINGTDYKTVLLNKGLLNIDEEADLDNFNSNYSRMEISGSSITNSNTIKGTNNNQQGMAQANAIGSSQSTITLRNDGIIRLSGLQSVGIYADYGIIENNNTIETTASKSYGIYGINGTEVITSMVSEIKSGSESAGIVLQSYEIDPITKLPVTTSGYGDGTFKLDHSGKIILSGNNSYGIYADNNDPSLIPLINNRVLNLYSGSIIDLSGTTDGSVGIYANRVTVNTQGDTKIGNKGIGIYSQSTSLIVNGGTMDLAENDSIAFVLKGDSNLTATAGVINISGDNNIAYVIDGAQVITSGLGNIQVNVDPGLKFMLASVKDNSFSYDGTVSNLGEKSILIYGDNSNVELGINAKVSSTKEKVTGLATSGQKAVNKGELLLTGSNSTGIYTDNANAENSNKLIMGINGIGIYNKGAGVDNISGEIQTGSGGVAIFGSDSAYINNNALINSTEKFVIGIYSEGNTTGTSILNDTSGNINLLGETSVGIYAVGTSLKTIVNKGNITLVNSLDADNPSVGIYSDTLGNTVQHDGTIVVGDNSLGIYNNGGAVIQNGSISTGNGGTALYSSGGTVNINSGASINIGNNNAAMVYAVNGSVITNNSSNITLGNNSFGFVLESGSSLINSGSIILGDKNVFIYGNEAGTIVSSNTASITATGSGNIVFYTVNGGNIINNSLITINAGTGNIGIYNNDGSIKNYGDIALGNSELAYTGNAVDTEKSRYSVGIYGENSKITNWGKIDLGQDAVAIYIKDNMIAAENYGEITAGSMSNPQKGAIGIFAEGGSGVKNSENITLYGENVIGIAGKNAGKIVNEAVISVTGKNAIGIYGTLNTQVENKGIINVSGENAVGIIASDGKILNTGIINFSNGSSSVKAQDGYDIPELINAGIINVDGHFTNEGIEISIKPDIDTLRESTVSGVDFTLNSGTISAGSMNITETVKILPDFSQGTNAKVYKMEDVFVTSNGTITSSNGKIPIVSKSLTWVATPKVNASGNIDIYMQKIDYHNFTDGLWYDDLGRALDEKYIYAEGNGMKIFDQIDLLENERDFRHVMGSMAGSVYANINQREYDIAKTFENSLDILQNSENNTKENVKISVIGGKGKNKEETDGVIGYDYTTTGVLALREVERTYKHTFGYSLGYVHTGFEFKDGNESEELVDTIQLGIHNKYKSNNWLLRNDITGRASIHNVDRNIDWPNPNSRSEMDGSYETYSITSDNILGREFEIGKKASIMPYGAFKAMYVTRPTFNESGLEALKVEGNDAWSVKPRAGIELKGMVPLGTNWQLKGTLDFAYEYELADLNEREKARLVAIEDGYHKLSKPQDEKGAFRTKAAVGVEVTDRYGIFLTGEYSTGNDKEDDYRTGVTVKAIF